MKVLFKNNNYKLLFAGNLVSEIGNSLMGIAMSFYILDLTGSSLSMGLFLFVVIGSRILFSPIAGVLVDRFNRVRVIYMTDYIRTILYVVLALYIATSPTVDNIILSLYITGVLSSLNAALFSPAMSSAIPEIVGEDLLQAANGASSIIQSLQSIIGVIAGAAFYAFFGMTWVIIINALSFGISGFSEMFIKTKYRKEKTNEETALQKEKTLVHDFVESLKYIKRRTGLFSMIGFSLLLNFAFTPLFAIGIPYLFNNDLARVNAEMEYAYTEVAFSIAMLIAGIIVGNMKMKKINKIIKVGLLLLSASFAYLALTIHLASARIVTFETFYLMFIGGMILLAVFSMLTNVPLNTGIVKIVDADYRGRVFATIGAISSGAVPISMLLGGVIIEYYNVSILGLFCVIVVLFPTIGILTNKKVKVLINSIDKHFGETQEVIVKSAA